MNLEGTQLSGSLFTELYRLDWANDLIFSCTSLLIYKSLKIIITSNSLNTHTHEHSSVIKDTVMPFYEESMVVNQINSQSYWLVQIPS